MSETKFKIAILIDGDNAESSIIEQMLNEASKFGRVTIKRIYADWTSPYMSIILFLSYEHASKVI